MEITRVSKHVTKSLQENTLYFYLIVVVPLLINYACFSIHIKRSSKPCDNTQYCDVVDCNKTGAAALCPDQCSK